MTTKHKFLRFSDCFVSHSIVTYYRIINKSNTTGATSGAELVYPSKSSVLTPSFSEVHVCSICSFLAVFSQLYCWLFVIFIFCHCVVCLSSNCGFWLPLLHLQTVCRLERKANQTYYVSLRSEFRAVMSVTISA